MDWQPIETEPRAPYPNGEVIVYCEGETPPVFVARFERMVEVFSEGWTKSQMVPGYERCSGGVSAVKDDFYGDPPVTPSHWMPLPLPPSPTSEE